MWLGKAWSRANPNQRWRWESDKTSQIRPVFRHFWLAISVNQPLMEAASTMGHVIEIVYQYDPDNEPDHTVPATAAEAVFTLQRGNRAFADVAREGAQRYVIPVSAAEIGIGVNPQTPIAAVLGCADARVPLELVFSQPANDMFVVRVAGNVLDVACVGSLDYAINHLPTLRTLAVVGHMGCGAVKASVDAYLDPRTYLGLSANLPLRAVVDGLMATVRGADNALRERYGHARDQQPGYYEALLDTTVVLNAAVAADALRQMFAEYLGEQLGVVFGVYDLGSRLVGIPHTQLAWRQGLFEPPAKADMATFADDLVQSLRVQESLAGY